MERVEPARRGDRGELWEVHAVEVPCDARVEAARDHLAERLELGLGVLQQVRVQAGGPGPHREQVVQPRPGHRPVEMVRVEHPEGREQRDQPATGAQDTPALGEDGCGIFDVLENVLADQQVELGVAVGDLLGVAGAEATAGDAALGGEGDGTAGSNTPGRSKPSTRSGRRVSAQ